MTEEIKKAIEAATPNQLTDAESAVYADAKRWWNACRDVNVDCKDLLEFAIELRDGFHAKYLELTDNVNGGGEQDQDFYAEIEKLLKAGV